MTCPEDGEWTDVGDCTDDAAVDKGGEGDEIVDTDDSGDREIILKEDDDELVLRVGFEGGETGEAPSC